MPLQNDFETSIKNVIVDLADSGTHHDVISVMQGDKGSRFIRFTVMNDGEPTDLTNTYAVLRGVKKDGTTIFNGCQIENNKVIAELTQNILSIDGIGRYEIALYSEDPNSADNEVKVISCFPFTINVVKSSFDATNMELSNEWTVLDEAMRNIPLMADLDDYIADVQEISGEYNNIVERLADAEQSISDIDGRMDDVELSVEGIGERVDTVNLLLNGHSVKTDVPSNAVFTDTTYSTADATHNGLESSAHYRKVEGIASGAEVNQNAFSVVKVGGVNVYSNEKTDELTLVGENLEVTGDASTKTITFGMSGNDVSDALGYTPASLVNGKIPSSELPTIVSPSMTNGNILIEGVETTVYDYDDDVALKSYIDNQVSAVAPTIADATTAWLDENVDPTGSAVMVDASLSISGAAGDAKQTGDEINELNNALGVKYYSKEGVTTRGELCKFYGLNSKYYVKGTKSNATIRAFDVKLDTTYTELPVVNMDRFFDLYYSPSPNSSYLRLYVDDITDTASADCVIIDVSDGTSSLANIINDYNVGLYRYDCLLTNSSLYGFSSVADLPVNKMFAISYNLTEENFSGLPLYGEHGTIVSFSPRLGYADKRYTVYLYSNWYGVSYIGFQKNNGIVWEKIGKTDTTLSESGVAADSKTVGDIIYNITNTLGNCKYYAKEFSEHTEIAKLYPAEGKTYDAFIWMDDNCSDVLVGDYVNSSNYTLIETVTTKNDFVRVKLIPSENTSYFRFYGRNVSGLTASVRVIVCESENIASDYAEDYSTDYMLSTEFSAVRKFTVIGDSLSSGYWKESSQGAQHLRELDYSWPQIMARIYGQTAVNATQSGATTKSWWTDANGYCKAQVTSDNKSQVYIMAIGINDYKDIPDGEVTQEQIGSFADVDQNDYNNNADSFWGNYCKIIQYIHDVAPEAKVICCTLPLWRNNTDFKQEVIREICNNSFFSDYVVLCDLDKDYKYLREFRITKGEEWQGHFTPVGYAVLVSFLMYAFSKTIQENKSVFLKLPNIDYDEELFADDIAPVEGSTASANYSVGDYVIFNEKFCKVTTSISVGTYFAIGTNLAQTTVGAELKTLFNR